jgi:glyoxylase-like metal-dependent hydrolase (beta-lactamase superfamily II)
MPQAWICVTCGVQFAPTEKPPQHCPICEDDRQYVGLAGQSWTTIDRLQSTHRNILAEEEPGLWSIRTDPNFAIGQRAYLIQTAEGNLLWDCIALLDADTIHRIQALGGIQAIAVSHPHYYSAMAAWSEAFHDAPIFIHEADRPWIAHPSPNLNFWSGEQHPLFAGIQLIRSGGHFDGYQVAHWPAAANGAGALFAGDQPQVCLDRRWVTFMYSYPNWIPFNATQVRAIAASLAPLAFDRLYGAFGRNLRSDAKAIVARSEERYLRAIAG